MKFSKIFIAVVCFASFCWQVEAGGPNNTPTGDGCGNGSGGNTPTTTPPGQQGTSGLPSGAVSAAGGVEAPTGSGGLCSRCNGRGGGGGNNGSGSTGGGQVCPPCSDNGSRGGGLSGAFDGSSTTYGGYAMPVWAVSEPYLNLWVYDEPLGYQPGVGNRIAFRLSYEQRPEGTISSTLFNCGTNWNFSWLSYFLADGSEPNFYVAGGGTRSYIPNYPAGDYFSMSRLTADGVNDMYKLIHPNGATDVYEPVVPGSWWLYLRTKIIDTAGHVTEFHYDTDVFGITRLLEVVDGDGRTNTISYTNTAFPERITGVTDPFGRSTTLRYNSEGMLTNIVDVGGISSSFVYDSSDPNRWMTNLITPYGTNTFKFVDAPLAGGQFDDSVNLISRAVTIVDPAGGTNLYMYRDYSGDFLTSDPFVSYGADLHSDPFTYDSTYVPTIPAAFDPYGTALGNNYVQYRNSWHWGPKQLASLSTNDMNYFTAMDYEKGRLRNWLHRSAGEVGQSVNFERLPSPDGVKMGQMTWYSYDNKSDNVTEGQTVLPSLVAAVLPDGNTWFQSIARNGWGHATTLIETYSLGYGTDVLFRTNQYTYDANGVDLLTAVGPNGETSGAYGYDSNHNIIAFTNAVGEVTTYTYDAMSRLTSTRTAAGLTTTNIYFASGDFITNWVQKTIGLEISRTNTYTYATNLVETHTDQRGLNVTNTWDNLQRLTGRQFPDGIISNIYSKLDLVERIDKMGFTNCYGYDAVRRLIAVTNELGHSTHFNYCSCGALDSIEDALGHLQTFTYDIQGRRTNSVDQDGYSVVFSYNSLGEITNVTDGVGLNVTNWYNMQAQKVSATNAFGQMFSRQYDIENRLTNSVDQNGVTVTYAYDDLGRRIVRGTPANGAAERFGYSAAGLIAYTNQITNITYYAYDPARRRTFETNANGKFTQFAYNSAGDLTLLIDGNNHSSAWGYDFYGRVTSKTNAGGTNILSYSYDPDGRLTNRWSLGKTNTIYQYDLAGNLTNVDYLASHDLRYTYDGMNRLTSMSDSTGTTTFTYTDAGLLKSENGPWDNDTVSYTYSARRRVSMSLQQPSAGAWTQTYGYDAGDRLQMVTSPAGTFTYSYSPGLNSKVTSSALVKKLLLPNGAYETNVFDTIGRITFHQLKKSDRFTVLEQDNPSYDLANRRTFATSMECEKTFGYDPIGQLTSDSASDIGGDQPYRMNEQLSYGYDAAGNLQYRTNNTVVENFQVNNLNELTTMTNGGPLTVIGTTTSRPFSVTVNGTNADIYEDSTFAATNMPRVSTYTAVASDGRRSDTNIVNVNIATNVTFSYDGNGNMVTDGLHTYEWNDENELTAIYVTNIWRSEFSYDGKLRCRIEKDFDWNGSSWDQTNEVRFVYDANVIVQHRNGNNTPILTLTRGKDLSGKRQGVGGIGGLLAMTETAFSQSQLATTYYHCDASGNVTLLLNSAQTVVGRYLYDPFGNTLSVIGQKGVFNPYRYSSKPIHVLAGTYDYLYRHYVPTIQRWANQDPRFEEGAILVFKQPIGMRVPASTRSFVLSKEINSFSFARNALPNSVDAFGQMTTIALPWWLWIDPPADAVLIAGGIIAAGAVACIAAASGPGDNGPHNCTRDPDMDTPTGYGNQNMSCAYHCNGATYSLEVTGGSENCPDDINTDHPGLEFRYADD